MKIPVTEEGSVERWHEYFEREYGRLVVIPEKDEKDYRQYVEYQFDEMCYSAMQFNKFIATVSNHSNDWPSFNRNLYRLHSILFFMTRLEKNVEKESLSFMGSYQVERIEGDFMEALDSVMSVKRREKYRPFIQKAVELVRENFLREKDQLFAWIYIYRLMCVTLLDSRDWLESETACLEEIMKGLKENRQGYYYTVLERRPARSYQRAIQKS